MGAWIYPTLGDGVSTPPKFRRNFGGAKLRPQPMEKLIVLLKSECASQPWKIMLTHSFYERLPFLITSVFSASRTNMWDIITKTGAAFAAPALTWPSRSISAEHATTRAYPGAQPHAPHLAEDRRIGCGVYYIAEALYVKFFCYFLIFLYICLKNFY